MLKTTLSSRFSFRVKFKEHKTNPVLEVVVIDHVTNDTYYHILDFKTGEVKEVQDIKTEETSTKPDNQEEVREEVLDND